jgi:predicted nuclease of predicted toxin-antitoxin system
MRLYLDDNLASPLLAQLLRNAGHDVQLPADVGKAGVADPVHLAHAMAEGRACLTANYTDFANLHNLLMIGQGHHPGILIVRQDNDPKRDLKPHEIVRAIHKLEVANYALADQYEILNHWR